MSEKRAREPHYVHRLTAENEKMREALKAAASAMEAEAVVLRCANLARSCAEALERKAAFARASLSNTRDGGKGALDGNELWELLFDILKGDVPEAITYAVLGELATRISRIGDR